jgi:hypothetical protein
MLDIAKAYEETQANLRALVRDHPEDALAGKVPATPDWSVLAGLPALRLRYGEKERMAALSE